jgi:hypothetical protein
MTDLRPEMKENLDDLIQGMDHIENLAWWATTFVKVVSGILVLIFAWLQFRSYEITQLIEKTEPEAFLRCIMFGYYLSWAFGPNFDVKIQKAAYVKDPQGGVITSAGFVLLILISLSAILMLWATQNEKTFFVALTGFIILNVAGHFFIFHRMRSVADSSGKLFYDNKRFFRFAKVVLVTEFMFGSWQRHRFLFMVVSVAFLDALCFLPPLRNFVSGLVHQLVPIDQNTVSSLLPDFGLMCFFIASEGWIWTQRLKISVAVATIDTLRRKYRLSLLSNT